MTNNNRIEITGANLVEVVKAAYDLSRPVGMGRIHFTPGPLTDDEAKSLIRTDSHMPVSLDYVKGRSCKFGVYKEGNKLYIDDSWYDHSEDDLLKLLDRIGSL